MYLMAAIRPRSFVELGTYYGVSYCAFCQAVHELGLASRCTAVDTWAGDAHMGEYPKDILDDLRRHHDPLYGSFSRLLQSNFDDAADGFAPGSIDLLHIDGYHTYDAVKHDFETWLPKLSRSAIVLFHDTNEFKKDFGVWRFIDELFMRYPLFEFLHGHGLAMVAVGDSPPAEVQPFFSADSANTRVIRSCFEALGHRVGLHSAAPTVFDIAMNRSQTAQSDAPMSVAEWLKSARLVQRVGSRLLPPGTRRRRTIAAMTRSARSMLTRSDSAAATSAPPAPCAPDVVTALRQELLRPHHVENSTGESPAVPHHVSVASFTFMPLFSIVIPTFNTRPRDLLRVIRSIQSQTYDNWELCICDDCSTNTPTLAVLNAVSDPRITIKRLTHNSGISSATNAAVESTRGEFVAFVDHDDALTEDALLEVVRCLNEKPDLDAIYSDHDIVDFTDHVCASFRKPDWSPEFLRSVMFPGHLLVLRRRIFDEVGGLLSTFDGVQDYELMLRAGERTQRIRHTRTILYHWHMAPGSIAADPFAKGDRLNSLQAEAVNQHLARIGKNARATPHPYLQHRCVVTPLPAASHRSVSIVIYAGASSADVGGQLAALITRSAFSFANVVLACPEDFSSPTLQGPAASAHVVICPGATRAAALNSAAAAATGEILVFLEAGFDIFSPDWIPQMLFLLDEPQVAAVGGMVVGSDRRVIHAGFSLDRDGVVRHAMQGLPADADGYNGSLSCPRSVSAVSSMCFMVRRADFVAAGGFSSDFDRDYADVDLCLRLAGPDRRIVYAPYATVTNSRLKAASAPPAGPATLASQERFKQHWPDFLRHGDPYRV
jgi:glycosyltransferase involved in cell wall biosynthesis